jgi:Nucleotidyl transferase AbiEii toxin, Type IV TA system
MTGEPEDVPPLARVVMPDVEQHGYRAYPLVDHVADKVCAIIERHGPTEAPSTRFRDLVDLVAIVLAASVEAEAQMAALRSEAQRRGLQLPTRFAVPDRALWETGYAAEAGRSLLPTARTLDEALATVRPFLDPLLDGTARGAWDPRNARWTS